MSDHLSTSMLEQYRRGLLPPGELLDADDHLAGCASCRELAAGNAAVRRVFAALKADVRVPAAEAPEHLSYEQIAAFVSQEADEPEREALLGHLKFCDVCAEDVRSLATFKAEMFAARERLHAPPAAGALQARPAGFKQRLVARLRALRGGPVIRFALSAAALILVVFLLRFLFVPSNRVPRDEVARTTPSPDEATRPHRPEQPQPPPELSNGQSGGAVPLGTQTPRGGAVR